MKKIIVALLCALLALAAQAQNVSIVTAASKELQRRGLDEGAVRARLLENGINLESIPRAELTSYRDRIVTILNQMEREKAASENGMAFDLSEFEADSTLTAQTTRSEEEAEKQIEEKLKEDNTTPDEVREIYGHALFTGKSMDVFRTTDGAQAPETYVLGEGDEVHISIFGSSQTEIHQRIASDGSIQPAGATKIFLKGLTLAQARAAVKSKLAQHYSFRQDQIAVTISTARTLTVNIYGEVAIQGGFTLSALNTAFNALAAAGGPTEIGSLRNIQRSRGGKTTRLDLYQFINGTLPGDQFDLQNNDILFVPVADRVVTVEGAVNRPMRYEMAEGEGLLELIRYAGGLTYEAYPEFVQIERFEDGEKVFKDYDLNKIISGAQTVSLHGGDIVRIKSVNKPMENYVFIGGDVYYGGSFDLKQNRSLQTLLDNAKPRYTARTEYVLVQRTRPDETVEVLTVPFPGIGGNPDFLLQARDSVKVLQLADFRDEASVSVAGQVRTPFSRAFGLNDRMSIGQAIELADGLRPNVYPVAYIIRTDITNPEKREYIPVNLERDREKLLQPGDSLQVYDNSTYTHMGEVRISGAVSNPMGTTFDPSLGVKDLILMAGGFEMGAAPDRVEVFRTDLSGKEAKMKRIPLQIDEDYNPTEPFELQPFDHLVVRQKTNFGMSRSVQVNGRVRYPGVYVLEDSRTQLSEIIAMAGGLQDDASPYCILFRAYGDRGPIGLNLKDAQSHKKNIKYDPILMEGDVINIVRQENTVTIRETGTRIGQYVPDEFSEPQKNLVYQGPRNAKWYINHYAGGFQKMADRNSVTVTMPNNQSEGTKRFLWMRIYPKVQPGSVITLSMDEKRIEKEAEPKEKVRWDQVASSTLSALTSVVSIILLVERLK